MKIGLLLNVSAIVLALYGLVLLVAPTALLYGALSSTTSDALQANLRSPAAVFLAFAVLNRAMHNADPSKALDAVTLGNAIAFALLAILQLLAVAGGAPVVEILPALVCLAFAFAFFAAGRTGSATATLRPARLSDKHKHPYRKP